MSPSSIYNGAGLVVKHRGTSSTALVDNPRSQRIYIHREAEVLAAEVGSQGSGSNNSNNNNLNNSSNSNSKNNSNSPDPSKPREAEELEALNIHCTRRGPTLVKPHSLVELVGSLVLAFKYVYVYIYIYVYIFFSFI